MRRGRLLVELQVSKFLRIFESLFGQNERMRSGVLEPARVALILLSFCFVFQVSAGAQFKGTRRVLLLTDLGTPASPGFTEIETAIFTGLQKSPYKIEFYEESMEAILFADESSQRIIREELIRKYSDRRPDAIVAAGSASLKFIAELHERFFPDTPVIFCGIVEDMRDLLKPDLHFTGVRGKPRPEATLNAALHLLPNTEHVVVVGGMGEFDRTWEAIAKEGFRNYESKLDFTYLTELEMSALLEQLKRLPSNSIVYHTSITQDAAGERFIDSAQAAPLVVGAANAPVFVMDDVDFRAGAVGGDLVNWADDGRVAADMVVRVLNGEKPQNIPIANSKDDYMFDWRAMQRWGIKESNLPPGSIVLNRPQSFWQLYKRYVLAGLLLVLAQMLAIFALLWQRAMRKETERELILSNEQLRVAMELGKSVGWELDIASGKNYWFGDLQSTFGIQSGTFFAQVGDFYRFVHPEDRESVSRAVDEAKKDHKLFNEEFRLARQDGATRWVVSRGEFDYTESGEALRMRGLAVDITDRKQMEETVRKSEEKFSKAFQESPLAFSLTSTKDHRYIEINETFERITGWSRAEIMGRTALDVGIWMDPDQRIEFINRLLAEGTVRDLEISYRARGGQVRTGLTSAELIEINGEPCALSAVADITEAKKSEEARQASERRFRQFFSTLPEYCYMTSPTGEILDVNPAACEALGYKKEELLRKPLSDLYAPESALKLVNLLEKWKRTGKLHNEEMFILTKEGKRRAVLLNAGAVKDAKEKVVYVASIQVDVTERKEILQKLRESQNRLKGIVESAMDAIIVVDEQQRIIVFNAAAEKMFACRARDAIGTLIHRFIPERFRDAWSAQTSHFGETRETQAMGPLESLCGLRVTGEEFPIEASISQTETDGWKVFTVIIRDITLSKQAEAALRESEERFRLVSNAAPVMIWMSGPDKLCTYFNEPWLKFTGRSIHAELGNGWAENVHAEDFSACLETYTKAFDRCEPFEMEYRLRRHDGEYRWVLDLGTPRFHQDGSFAGYIGSCIDVTERKLAEESLANMSRKLIEAQEQERTWIARELHDDISQRITLVLVNLERLQKDFSPLAPAVTQRLSEIQEHLSGLASDIQALSHHLHSSKLEYLGLVTAAASFCRELSEEHGVEVVFHSESVPKQLPHEVALCLFRVLQESLQNAVKHSGSKHFEAWLKGTPTEIELTVRDSGVGFDAEEAMSGRGLGLTSMKERLKLVHGKLSVDSHLARGTVIRASVPLNFGARAASAGT
jgi:PAS domain S-box-containing protein